MQPEQQELVERVATCHTEGCDHADIAVAVQIVDENTTVVCGVCFHVITDVVTEGTS